MAGISDWPDARLQEALLAAGVKVVHKQPWLGPLLAEAAYRINPDYFRQDDVDAEEDEMPKSHKYIQYVCRKCGHHSIDVNRCTCGTDTQEEEPT